jgi:hypothetical protein
VKRRVLLGLALAAIVAVTALAVQRWTNRAQEAPAPGGVPAAGVEGTDADAAFTLRIRAESVEYRFGEPIQIRAWLMYLGPKDQELLAGSFSGIVLYSWEQLNGPLRRGNSLRLNCQPYVINRGQPIDIPFGKNGAFSGDDPDAAFWRQYFADPAFRLPVGRYRIHAKTFFYIGDCRGPKPDLDAAVQIQVLP